MGLIKNQSSKYEEITDYLNEHPDFFIHHPEILSAINIPHKTTENVSSLIEYQVKNLRQEILELNTTINDFKDKKDRSRKLAKQVNKLVVSIFKETKLNKIYDIVNFGLKKHYNANDVLIYIFSESKNNLDYSGLRFFDQNSKIKFMFTEIFHRNKPLCGSLQEEHIKTLFGNQENSINSTILIPLQQQKWQGLLVIGSQEHNCYSHGFELDLLVYLSEILSLSMNKGIK